MRSRCRHGIGHCQGPTGYRKVGAFMCLYFSLAQQLLCLVPGRILQLVCGPSILSPYCRCGPFANRVKHRLAQSGVSVLVGRIGVFYPSGVNLQSTAVLWNPRTERTALQGDGGGEEIGGAHQRGRPLHRGIRSRVNC